MCHRMTHWYPKARRAALQTQQELYRVGLGAFGGISWTRWSKHKSQGGIHRYARWIGHFRSSGMWKGFSYGRDTEETDKAGATQQQ